MSELYSGKEIGKCFGQSKSENSEQGCVNVYYLLVCPIISLVEVAAENHGANYGKAKRAQASYGYPRCLPGVVCLCHYVAVVVLGMMPDLDMIHSL